jgi:hypothetical protein
VEQVSIYAARRDDGTLTVLVVNLADEAREATLLGVGQTAELWRLAPGERPEEGAPVAIPAGEPLTLPAQSVSLYLFHP